MAVTSTLLPDELLLSRRNSQQAKEAERLEPKGTLNRAGILGDSLVLIVLDFLFHWVGRLPIGSNRRRLLYQSTQVNVANSTSSMLRQGPC